MEIDQPVKLPASQQHEVAGDVYYIQCVSLDSPTCVIYYSVYPEIKAAEVSYLIKL